MTESPSSSSLADFIPLAEDDDPEDVALALETAGALGGRGDMREALRWLRKASEAADDAGRDKRSLALARAAADIATRLASIPPPPVSVPQSLGPDDVVAAAAA
ncbi:MAG TPA: hypothetical protein VGP93_10895, partial [Polyangiaceae bacterium]|nr:hypothetical protein [Polyangiaceae bacterium]